MLQLKLEPVEESQINLKLSCKSIQRLNLSLNHQPVIGMQLGVKLDNKLVLNLAPFYRGERGLPGGSSIDVVASGPIGGHRAVVLTSAGAAYATNQNPQHGMKVLGVTTNAAAAGGTLSVVRSGKMSEPSWSFDTSKPVFLGVDGLLTQVAPAYPAAAFSLIVGFPLSATELFVGLREPLGLGA